MSKKLISLFLTVVLLVTGVLGSFAGAEDNTGIQTEVFIRQQLFTQFALFYDTFNAAIVLEDGSEITGIGFTDYSAYYEADDESVGYFPAGFIADFGYVLPVQNSEEPFVIENLDFTDDRYQFVYDSDTVPFMEHCVRDGQYLKYGVDERGSMAYEISTYERGVCDESLGALYSYDTGKFVFDPDVGNYVRITGRSLFEQIDYDAIQAEVDRLIADQNERLSEQEVISSVHIAQEAVVSYLLSMQQESFLGYNVKELVDYASGLDPMECVQITPDGLVVVRMTGDVPGGPSELAKWLVGIGCGIVVIASTALNMFVPAARPLCGAITGAAIEVFMQVVINNKTLDNMQWEKVAVAAVSGATMAWLCPMAASGVTSVVTKAGGKVLGKLAGYGVMTLANGAVSGLTGYANARIDGKDGWPAFKQGLIIGAGSTVVASLLAEAVPFLGPKVSSFLNKSNIGKKINSALGKVNEAVGKADLWIRGKQVHLPEKLEGLESILSPKSVHQAAECAWREANNQAGALGGRYGDLTNPGDGTMNKHEMPSREAYAKVTGVEKRGELPSIKMDATDHRLTASCGGSEAAEHYREVQAQLIAEGNMRAAIQMDINDLTSKFGTKYNDHIQQMLEYATQMGWW